jgi:hypothetical protein
VDYKISRLGDSLSKLIRQVTHSDKPVSENTQDKMKYLVRASEIAQTSLKISKLDNQDERRLKDLE